MQGKINDLKSLGVKEVYHFQYSRRSKTAFKIHSFHEALTCRMIDFSEAAILLMAQNHIVPSLSLIRALFENIALLNRIKTSMLLSIRAGKLIENFDDLITTVIFGTRIPEDDLKAINIATHLSHLDKEFPGIKEYYDSLCEFVHPNSDGVFLSYSMLNENEDSTLIQKIVSKKSNIFPWIESCFILSMGIYIEYSLNIKELLPEFTKLCEIELRK